MFSLISAWINSWVNNPEAGDFRCHCAHYDVTVMIIALFHITWYCIQHFSNWHKIKKQNLYSHPWVSYGVCVVSNLLQIDHNVTAPHYCNIAADCRQWISSWRHHPMETFSALLALCVGNSPVIDEFPSQRPVTQSFDVFFDLGLNKRLTKQLYSWWFEIPSRSL